MIKKTVDICVVDDDDIYQFTIERIIKCFKLPVNLTAFTNGKRAFEFISDNIQNRDVLPDIIFLDINMPVMNGYEFIEKFEKIKSTLQKEIKIYLVSSSVDPYDINRADELAHVSGYFSKPLKHQVLKEIVYKQMNPQNIILNSGYYLA